jgi:Tol biopolymer transport system component
VRPRAAARGAVCGRTVVAVAVATVAVAVAAPAGRAASSRILFESDWSRTRQVYAVTPDGRRVAQLTFGPYAYCPEWKFCGRYNPEPSPDGRRLLFTGGDEPNGTTRLFVARADGTRARQVAVEKFGLFAAWAPDSRRFAFLQSGRLALATVDGAAQRWIASDARAFAWSSKGRLAFATSTALHVARGTRVQTVAADAANGFAFAWAPDGNRLAYEADEAIVVVSDDGRRRSAVASIDNVRRLAWSKSGRFLAYTGGDPGITVVDVATGAKRSVAGEGPFAWSPRGAVLAYDNGELAAMDAATGQQRILSSDEPTELAWSPDGRSIAYVAALERRPRTGPFVPGHPLYYGGDLKVVDGNGTVRTLVAARGPYGGAHALRWTLPRGVRYRSAVGRTIAKVSRDELVAPWNVVNLAADGSRVAYQSCNHVFVWTPRTGAVEQAEPVASLSRFGCGPWYEAYRLFDLGIAGDQVAHGASIGNMSQSFWLGGINLSESTGMFTLGSGWRNAGSPTPAAVGELAGAGESLFFSEWYERGVPYSNPYRVMTERQRIRRVGPAGCPCPIIAEAEGPLVPLDGDAGRVLVAHEFSLSIHNRDGAILLSVPPAKAAALRDRDLVAVDGAILRHHDSFSGNVLHEWRLPTERTGRRCANPGFLCSDGGDLVLEDVARGRVAYVFGGSVHVLRLVDGRDEVVAGGTLATFVDEGLVYANANTLKLIPFERLP